MGRDGGPLGRDPSWEEIILDHQKRYDACMRELRRILGEMAGSGLPRNDPGGCPPGWHESFDRMARGSANSQLTALGDLQDGYNRRTQALVRAVSTVRSGKPVVWPVGWGPDGTLNPQ